MSDRTYYSIQIQNDPELTDEECSLLVEQLEFERFDRWQVKDGGPTILALVVEGAGVGQATDFAETLRKALGDLGKDQAFSVREDPAYEWLGTLVSYDPSSTHLHEVDCDAGGNALINDSTVQQYIDDANGSFDALATSLRHHLGLDR